MRSNRNSIRNWRYCKGSVEELKRNWSEIAKAIEMVAKLMKFDSKLFRGSGCVVRFVFQCPVRGERKEKELEKWIHWNDFFVKSDHQLDDLLIGNRILNLKIKNFELIAKGLLSKDKHLGEAHKVWRGNCGDELCKWTGCAASVLKNRSLHSL